MGASTPSTEIDRADPTVEALARAVRQRDWAEAQRLVDQLGDAPPQAALRPAAEVHLARGRYKDAARLLNRIIDRDDACLMQRRLALNLAAMTERDSKLAARIAEADGSRYQIIRSKSGHPTLCRCEPDGRRIALSAGADPPGAARGAMQSLAAAAKLGSPIGLLGLGDGYILHALAHHGPQLPLGYQQLVHVVEPDPALVRACMCLHDYSGEDGPIALQRFRWWIGEDYEQQMREFCIADPCYLPPMTHVNQSVAPQTIAAAMSRVWQALHEHDRGVAQQVQSTYAHVTAGSLAELFGPDPPRKPRVLVLTTRYSTVLQYSSRDIVEAMDALGYETLLLIEAEPWTTNTLPSTRRAIASFKPDVMIQIDHLRHEHTDVVPPQMPFVCWIQDLLPHLINRSAGANVDKRDYVLTSIAPLFADSYSYPPRQLIDICKLTRVPQRPAAWQSDGDDLVYVSNASQLIDTMIDQAAGMIRGDAAVARIVRQTGRRMQQIYERGEALPTLWHVRGVLDSAIAEQGAEGLDPDLRRKLLHLLNHPLNNTLYRQQALRWVVATAKRRNLKLALYGNGWEKHPEFAAHARGSVQYGPDLEQLTRRSRINLQIVPSYCLHQRMLDGLAAGGFFLVRSTPADRLLSQIAAFMRQYLSSDVQSVAQARDTLDADARARLDDLLARCVCLQEFDGPVDLIQWVRCCMRAQLLDGADLPIPRYDDVAFDDEASFDRLVERYMDNPELRREIADAQWRSIEHRLTYTAGMKRVMHRVAQLLAQE